MHGPLIDSHHRSSISSNGLGALSSSEHTLTDDDHTNNSSNLNHPIVPSSAINSIKIVPCLSDVVENDIEKESTTPTTHSPNFFRWTPGHRHVMLTFFTICLFAFMTGIEYAVILPTAFEYVKTMTQANIYVGLILSSYSISGSIAGIIMGKISDITGKVKILILICTAFEIGGNILYFVSNNIYIVLLGRLIAGVGMGAVPPILADVAHRTTENDRTKAISIILGCRQLGLLIGPCFTLLIRLMNFHIGSIHIYKLNGPGFLMATVWLILTIVCSFCFYDRAPSVTTGPSTLHTHSTNDSLKHKYTRSDHPVKEKEQKISFKTYCDQYIRIEMIVLFLATFIIYFNQTALETIVAAFTEKHFNWTIVDTSILFAFAGLEIIVVYLLLVKFLSKRFEDRMLLIFGFISLTLACIVGTFFTWASYALDWSGYLNTGFVNKRLLSMFIIFVILDLLGLPFIAATSVSLFTKLTNKDFQGVSQGIQRFIMGIGTVVGPLFASSLLNHLHIMMTAMLTLTFLTLIAIFFVVKRLRPLSKNTSLNDIKNAHNNNHNHSSSLENEPVLTSTLPLKNCYITLVPNDEQNDYLLEKKSNSSLKRLSINNSNDDLQNQSLQYDTSSTNILCLSDEQNRSLNNHKN